MNKKIYMLPSVRVQEMEAETILAGSVNGGGTGSIEKTDELIESGSDVGAKFGTVSFSDDDYDE